LPRSRKELEHRLPAPSAPIKEYFADKECHTCGKKGHPARFCLQKKGKAKKDLEDDKLVFSGNKSAKTIKSPTKQVKSLEEVGQCATISSRG
jgi:hypothetical protein